MFKLCLTTQTSALLTITLFPSLHTSLLIISSINILYSSAPNFTAQTQLGSLDFHEFIDNKWAILFSHPKDFTPVCATELGRVAQLKEEWASRNTVVVGLSVDTVEHHNEWIQDINQIVGTEVTYPIISDADRKISLAWGMLNESDLDAKGLPVTVRSVFFVDPNKKIQAVITYPPSTGRNFDEIIRVVDSLQTTFYRKLATPVDWKRGTDVVVSPKLSTEDATELYGPVETIRPWLRKVADPGAVAPEDYTKSN